MLDIHAIRTHPDLLDAGLIKRHKSPIAQSIIELDKQLRLTLTQLQDYQAKRNKLAQQIGLAKKNAKNIDESDGDGLGQEGELIKQGELIKYHTLVLQDLAHQQQEKLHDALKELPNLPDEECPIGKDEADNVVVSTWGVPGTIAPNVTPSWDNDFIPKHHYELGETLGQMNFAQGVKLSGARFVVLHRDLARLERALANFMLDHHQQVFGYDEVAPPLLVKEQTMFGTGQLPKMKPDLFQLSDGLFLIPTSEVVLTNLVAEEIVDEAVFPLRYVAHTPCFRSEAGAAGKDTRGMIRLHQFMKVELVSITTPQQSATEHERMVTAAQTILEKLGLPYRKVLLCTGDMGFSAKKTYDLEVWMPAQKQYREISSCSNCGDFQARRMNARYRPRAHEAKAAAAGKTAYLHTLNGSGVAVGRALCAILENYQQVDGNIRIPEVLVPYMGGQKMILSPALMQGK